MVLAVAIPKVSVKSIIELLTANLPRPFRFFAGRSFTLSPVSLSVLSWPDADVLASSFKSLEMVYVEAHSSVLTMNTLRVED